MTVSVRLTDEQLKAIDESGLNRSEFIRRAVDYYLKYRYSETNAFVISELERFISTVKKDTTVLNNNTTVPQCNTSVLHNNTSVLDSNTSVLHNNTSVLDNNTSVLNINTNSSTKQAQNTKHLPKPENKHINNIFQLSTKDLETIQRMLKNPLNTETIPDHTLKLLAKRYDVSKSTMQSWIHEHKTELKDLQNQRH